MPEPWRIIFYQGPTGSTPIGDFIDGLEEKVQAKVFGSIELLKEYGVRLSAPHAKKLAGTNLWELRILGGGSSRIIYAILVERKVILLNGFKKKQQKTPIREIIKAQRRLTEYQTQII
ncbi:type II toxin-antitoxin system RelE/ParE family toxin [Candidatus Roizmanbacteria bacterium CG10_big_fil_rev_8_21_14_0_10_45_7]|uniref:Type II toxin-antitoxin system RelE/ParE family toxin n=1 Tax=Candidatus Roizmanbacteria bacterium CG10_big_fil_rev_8_21_14_0_10_45_7 TaxID=1974854 RepID=A0A2M8KVE5_9BACT|nr:MAG: type II toxin-antitoxin system RelE/ParE family toxin [Candidatus Roizmanbacteria bacterium CG10_big_fil_rev_8_21_14_0_10_45_7]